MQLVKPGRLTLKRHYGIGIAWTNVKQSARRGYLLRLCKSAMGAFKLFWAFSLSVTGDQTGPEFGFN
jgi:hypothetical protein